MHSRWDYNDISSGAGFQSGSLGESLVSGGRDGLWDCHWFREVVVVSGIVAGFERSWGPLGFSLVFGSLGRIRCSLLPKLAWYDVRGMVCLLCVNLVTYIPPRE
jgi:hypothetical protein